ANRATMQDRTVPDCAASAHRQGKTDIRMHDSVFLHVRIVADRDRFIVTAQNRAEPDADIAPDVDIADHHGVRRHPTRVGFGKSWGCSLQGIDRHRLSSLHTVNSWKGRSITAMRLSGALLPALC